MEKLAKVIKNDLEKQRDGNEERERERERDERMSGKENKLAGKLSRKGWQH